MNINFTVDFTGTADADDVLAARRLIRIENERRALLDPPGTPLPFNNGANLKASALLLCDEVLTNAWLSYIEQAKKENRFTQAQIDTIHANLNARLNAGEDPAAIVADTAS